MPLKAWRGKKSLHCTAVSEGFTACKELAENIGGGRGGGKARC